MNYQYEPFENENDFEEFLLDLFNLKFDSSFELYKSKGARQYGVDIYSAKQNIAIQAKKKDLKRSKSTIANELYNDLEESFKKVAEFKFPINTLILASTTPKFGNVQDKAYELTDSGNVLVQFLSWADIEKEIPRYPSLRAKYYPHLISENSGEILTNNLLSVRQKKIPKRTDSYELFDGEYWSSLIIPDPEKRIKSLQRYYTHIHTSLVSRVIANDGFAQRISPDVAFNVSYGGKTQVQMISQVLDATRAESFGFIKILGEGGAGKTTFLYTIGKTYHGSYTTYLLKKFTTVAANELISHMASTDNNQPFLMLIDNIREIFDDLPDYFSIVKDWAFNNQRQIVLVCTERESRYNDLTLKLKQKFEDLFEGNVYFVDFLNVLDKADIFERLIPLLVPNHKLKVKQMELAKGAFLQSSIKGVSESTYNLIKFLKINSEIDLSHYEFDWNEWRQFIKRNSEFKEFDYLFIAVATFYYFGIGVPTEFAVSYFKSNTLRLTEAITLMGTELSPISFMSREQHNDTLILKNEFVANWFFDNSANTELALSFFKTFIKDISLPGAAWLFRKINKALRNGELQRSPFSKLLTLADANFILEGANKSDPEECQKNKMELGLNYLKTDRERARLTFEEILVDNPDNIYALYQLAELNSKDPKHYQQAYDNYVSILKGDADNIRALTGLYKLLQNANKYNSILVQNKDFEYLGVPDISEQVFQLSPHALNVFLLALVDAGELDVVEKILLSGGQTAIISGECYIKLATKLPFAISAIMKKSMYYEIGLSKSKKNIDYSIKAAVFFYRVTEFTKSTKIKELLKSFYPERADYIEQLYRAKVRSTQKLFFPELSPVMDKNGYAKALFDRFKSAKVRSGKKASVIQVMQAYHLFVTVCFHSYKKVPDLYFDTAKRIGAIHFHNAKKQGWNNLTPEDNLLMAEHMFESLFSYVNDDLELNRNLLWCLVEQGKFNKLLRVSNQILSDQCNLKIPVYHRLRGSAYKNLGDFSAATYDYSSALELCETWDGYKSKEDKDNERSRILSSLIICICECLQKKLDSIGFTKADAKKFFGRLEKKYPDFKFLEDTRNKLDQLP